MGKNIIFIWSVLSFREKVYGILLIIFGLLNSGIQGIGVASVMPFITVLNNLDCIKKNQWLLFFYDFLGFQKEIDFLVLIGGIMLLLFILAALMGVASTYLNARFVNGRILSLSNRVFQSYLTRPYEYFLGVNSSEVIQNIVTQVNQFVISGLAQLLALANYLLLGLTLFIVLILSSPFISLLLIIIIFSIYGIIYYRLRLELYTNGCKRTQANQDAHKSVSELVGGIKEILISGRHREFSKQYLKPSHEMCILNTRLTLIKTLPSAFIQIFALGGVLLLALLYIKINKDTSMVLPIIALYAAAAYRLMPAMTGIFQSLTVLKSNTAVVDIMRKILDQGAHPTRKWLNNVPKCTLDSYSSRIEAQNIFYRYPNIQRNILHDISFEICRGSSVAFVGSTGAGKTTLIDILTGLLLPSSGKLIVDGMECGEKNRRLWQDRIGYVPQHIYLCDDTLERNIAFGINDKEIDFNRIQEVASIAQIDNFICTQLPQGYKTIIGERGIRLSGGQRQRIGLARALYMNPAVLILDEATSALDNITEIQVMKGIRSMTGSKTIIMIAHRLSTIENCDCIFVLDQGRIVGAGNYNKLLHSCFRFQEMARASTSVD